MTASRPDGRIIRFFLSIAAQGNLAGPWVPDSDIADKLVGVVSGNTVQGWKLIAEDGETVELYDLYGSLLQISDRQGLVTRLGYSDGAGQMYYSSASPTTVGVPHPPEYVPPQCVGPNAWAHQLDATGQAIVPPNRPQLMCVSDPFGRQINLQYDAAFRVIKIADAAAGVFTYEHNGPSGGCTTGASRYFCDAENLTRVTFPDGQSRIYHYNEVANINNGAACPGISAYGLTNWHLVNHLTGITDENGQRYSTYKYDCQGRATSTEHAGGVDKIAFAYDSPAAGQTSVTYTQGASTAPTTTTRTFGFAVQLGMVRLTGISAPCLGCGANSATTYDSGGNVASRVNWNGYKTCYANDLNRKLETRRIEGLSGSTDCASMIAGTPVLAAPARMISTEWSADWRQPTKVAEPLRVTTYTYGPPTASNPGDRGNVLTKTIQATTDATGALGLAAPPTGTARTWTYTYDTVGQVLSANGPRTDVADITTYAYYPSTDSEIGRRGNVASVTNALGHVTQITSCNPHGQPLTVVDPNGLTTQLTYDSRQRLKSRNVGGEVTVYDYDPVGQLIKATLPDNSFVTYGYDAAHRMTSIGDNLGNRIVYTLDLRGNRTKEEVFDPANALAQTRSRVYDALNRMVQSIGAQNQTTSYTYDPQGNLIMVNDPLNRMTTNAYDALNRLVAVTQPSPGANQPNPVISYGYDGQDQLTRVTDPRNLVTNYTMTGLGDATLQVSPDTGTTARTFDAAGNVATSTDARGKTTIYTYDALNRVLTKRYGGASGTKIDTFRYDEGANGKGRLTTLVDSSGTTAWTYDLQGRVTSRRQTKAYGGGLLVTTYGYDAAGRLVSMVYPSGRTARYTYDLAGRVSALSIDNTSIVSGITWHPFGQPKAWVWGNSTVASRTFDADGRMRTHPVGGATRTVTYDNADRITQINDGPVNSIQIFSYDDLDRVTGFVASNTSRAYTYDANGNRTNLSIGVNSYNYTTAANSNRLLSSAGPVPASTFAYDAAGNAVNLGGRTFTYDDSGRISTFVDTMFTSYPSNYIKEIQFNGLGQRVNKIGGYSNNYANTDYAYDEQGRLIGDYQGSSAIREYVYLGDIPIAVLADNPSVIDNGGTGFSVAGTWSSTTGSDALGGGYLYRAAGTGANSATWAPSSLPSGGYNVYARWVSNTDRATNATYQVSHLGGVTSVVVNQKQRSGQWVFLGSFTLISGAGHKVTLTDSADGVVVADAVKFLPADASSVYTIDTDHLNTPRAVRSQAGTTIWRWDSDPFGDLPPNDDPDGNGLRFSFPLRFPGQYFDAETGLHYNYFRDYDPRTGRYVQSDPIGLAGGINTYTYVMANPLSRIDPRGLDSPRLGPYHFVPYPRCAQDQGDPACEAEVDKYERQMKRDQDAVNKVGRDYDPPLPNVPEPRLPLIPLPDGATGSPDSMLGDPLRQAQRILDRLNPPQPAKGSTSSGRRASLPLRRGVDECRSP